MTLKTFFEYDGGKILLGDCLELLTTLKTGCVDLTLTDPPYGVGVEYDKFNDSKEELKTLVDRVMPEVIRVSKRVLLTCGVYNIQLYPTPKWILAWVNKAGTGRNPWGFTCWSPVLAYGKDPFLANRMGSRPDVIEHCETSDKTIDHPCPKPLNFWEKLLLRGSVSEDDIILDPFVGSGTTLVVARKNKRKAIGIDISEKYCEVAKKRLLEETN